jgi:Flp pilus assembly protein TadB
LVEFFLCYLFEPNITQTQTQTQTNKQNENERARNLYVRLLERTKHVKVWISLADFESSIENFEQARKIYIEAYDLLKQGDTKEEVMFVCCLCLLFVYLFVVYVCLLLFVIHLFFFPFLSFSVFYYLRNGRRSKRNTEMPKQ